MIHPDYAAWFGIRLSYGRLTAAGLDTRAAGELPRVSGTGVGMASSRRATATKAAHWATAKPAAEAESQDQPLLERLLLFSDAVFAIVLTILVLELRPPEAQTAAELKAGLMALTPNFVAFAMTFVVISIFWAAQMNTLRPAQFAWALILLLFGLVQLTLRPRD